MGLLGYLKLYLGLALYFYWHCWSRKCRRLCLHQQTCSRGQPIPLRRQYSYFLGSSCFKFSKGTPTTPEDSPLISLVIGRLGAFLMSTEIAVESVTKM